jgi:putative SOS response-associated peptidase YedK
MCYHTKQTKGLRQIEQRFKAKAETQELFSHPAAYNGFTFPVTPVILNSDPQLIQGVQWGLIPSWSKNEEIRAYTLNAKIETLKEKPSFRNCLHQRCIVIADGFYEWKWLDSSGKKKQKYLITMPDESLFSFAGLYAVWTHPVTGNIKITYTIVTTEANEFMAEIHNHKKRMPIILDEEQEQNWLYGLSHELFAKNEVELKAVTSY